MKIKISYFGTYDRDKHNEILTDTDFILICYAHCLKTIKILLGSDISLGIYFFRLLFKNVYYLFQFYSCLKMYLNMITFFFFRHKNIKSSRYK